MPKRLKDDILIMSGYWEPDSFIIRGGRSSVDIHIDDSPYSEEMAKKLSDLGVNLAVYPFYKGLGIRTEQPAMDRTARFFELLDKYNIHKGTYINIASVFADTFFAENPDMRKLLAIDQYGEPHFYSEFYRCYYRYRLCNSSEEFARYVAQAALKAVNEAKTDLVFFDNSAQMPCYCEHCKKAFPEHILRKYPMHKEDCREGQLSFKERFGYDYMGSMQMPRGTARMPIDVLPGLHEPMLYEWVRFRQEQVESLHKHAFDVVRGNDQGMAISWNIALDEGEFAPLLWGLDPESAGRLGSDFFFSEDSNHAGIEGGELMTHIRTFKYAWAMGNLLFIHNTPGGNDAQKRLNYVQAAAFNNGCVGHVMWGTERYEDLLELKRSADFLRANRDMFINTEPLAKLAIYRSNESETMNFSDTTVSRLAIEQVLIANSIQYDYILNSSLDRLARYQAVVLPNAISVSDDSVKKLSEYVKNSGKLICFENSMVKDEYGRKRIAASDMGLYGERDNVLGLKSAPGDVGTILTYLGLSAQYAPNIIHVPRIDFAKRFAWQPVSAKPVVIGKEFYVLPHDHRKIFDIVKGVIGHDYVEICGTGHSSANDGARYSSARSGAGCGNVICGLFRDKHGRKLVHIFDHDCRAVVNGARAYLFFDDMPELVDFVSFDSTQKLAVKKDAWGHYCDLPPFTVYAGVRI